MSNNQEQVRSIEITAAIRDVCINNLQVKKGNYIGIIDGELKVTCHSLGLAVLNSLEEIDAGSAGIVTIFYGNGVKRREAISLADSIKTKYQGPEIEIIQGSQPHYSYIISVEWC